MAGIEPTPSQSNGWTPLSPRQLGQGSAPSLLHGCPTAPQKTCKLLFERRPAGQETRVDPWAAGYPWGGMPEFHSEAPLPPLAVGVGVSRTDPDPWKELCSLVTVVQVPVTKSRCNSYSSHGVGGSNQLLAPTPELNYTNLQDT
jgi:hypothetical protein